MTYLYYLYKCEAMPFASDTVLNVNLYMICYEKVLLHFACDSVRTESECPEWWGGLLHASVYGGMCGKY